jgi:hypothetical protein
MNNFQNPAPDLEEQETGEISGEFGDNVSMSSRGRSAVTPDYLDMPPEEVPTHSFLNKYKPMNWHHMKALIWKNAMSLLRNYGYVYMSKHIG